jgi:hypothetical protein
MQSNKSQSTIIFTHEVTRDEPYYITSPGQGRPPDGTFKAGTKVSVSRGSGSYSYVVSEGDISAYVSSAALKHLKLGKAHKR